MMIQEKDINILNGLHYDENAEPNFEILKYCLIWPDEKPVAHLSKEGREFLMDLFITRGFIHRQLPKEQWGLTPQSWQNFNKIWEFGLINIPNWPGFRRVQLSEAEKKILTEYMRESSSFS